MPPKNKVALNENLKLVGGVHLLKCNICLVLNLNITQTIKDLSMKIIQTVKLIYTIKDLLCLKFIMKIYFFNFPREFLM